MYVCIFKSLFLHVFSCSEEGHDALQKQRRRRQKRNDKVVNEWKAKADDIIAELEASRSECRNYNSEVFRLKAAYDETVDVFDLLDLAEGKLFEVTQGNLKKGSEDAGDLVKQALKKRIEEYGSS